MDTDTVNVQNSVLSIDRSCYLSITVQLGSDDRHSEWERLFYVATALFILRVPMAGQVLPALIYNRQSETIHLAAYGAKAGLQHRSEVRTDIGRFILAGNTMSEKRERLGYKAAAVERIRIRDGDSCWLCQHTILFWPERHPELGSVTIDHVWPVSLGGDDEDENFRLAHWLCNNVRGNSIDPEEIKARIATLFVDGQSATQKYRRELLIRSVGKQKEMIERLDPFCAWPRNEMFRMWPAVDEWGNVFLTNIKPEYLH